ncbi:MAG: hypothetical protein M1817_000843 [Caeruleum heppii]|nr:MAG: hypothetical protein M1817_000843 [Caeruleum heppii]
MSRNIGDTGTRRTTGGTSVETPKKELWSSMLDDVASGRSLPEKNLLVLGGSPEAQKDFLQGLSNDIANGRKHAEAHSGKRPPLANQFALGYTYEDIWDADHEDLIARLSIYLLSDPSPSFTPLLKTVLSPQTIPHTLIVILLDWSDPWRWLRQLRQWVWLLRSLAASLSEECKDAMEETMTRWRNHTQDLGGRESAGKPPNNESMHLPLGTGEWDEVLGLPLCVVCQNADHMTSLESEQGWKEETFDFVQQSLRTILLKHGASLVYTSRSSPNLLQSLVYASLGIQSTLKRQILKHNVVDRDRVLVPPNWDSWGKIRVLKDGFDVEGISAGWSTDIARRDEASPTLQAQDPDAKDHPQSEELAGTESPKVTSGAVIVYEGTIRNPREGIENESYDDHDGLQRSGKLEAKSINTQDFLRNQSQVMDRIRAEDGPSRNQSKGQRMETIGTNRSQEDSDARYRDGISATDRGRVDEHIGPVQFNTGGIQMDADDMLKRLQVQSLPFKTLNEEQF